jgi:hypothetical protein
MADETVRGEPVSAFKSYQGQIVIRTKMFHVKHFGTIDAKRTHARLAQKRWSFAQASSSTAVAVA